MPKSHPPTPESAHMADDTIVPSTLRFRVRRLIDAKLTGQNRKDAYRFASSPHRKVSEMEALRARLEPLPDVERERGVMARLSPEQVAEMRRLRADGWKVKDLEARFGVTHSTVSKLTRGTR